MSSPHPSQSEKRLSKNADRVQDMAAQLLAELFYKQCMTEPRQVSPPALDATIDNLQTKGLH
jgi:hypothetical protein